MYVGYLLHFDRPNFNKKALSALHVPGHIASLSAELADWHPRGVEACIITADGKHIDHIALARQGDMIVTGEYRLIFHHLTRVTPVELSPDDLAHFARISTHVCSRAPAAIWERLVNQFVGESQDNWTKLLARLEQSRRRRDEAGYDIMAMERDAIGVALEISAFDRSAELELREKILPGPSPYINRLREASRDKAIEDRLIDHDALVFEKLRLHHTDVVGTTVFEKPLSGERLFVTNANRTPIESTLGVDLVYFNDAYQSFVMVQYKRLRRESNDYIYRPELDDSYKKEIDRMLEYESRLRSAAPSTPLDFRLDPGVFYFKLCADAFFDQLTVSMIEGMYFPVRYWQILCQANGVDAFVGTRGARRVSYDKTGRCMSNDLFSKLVRFGWIGSQIVNYQMLQDCIASALEEKRSVLLTQNTRNKPTGAAVDGAVRQSRRRK